MAKKALLTVDGTHRKLKKTLITVDGVHKKIKKALISVDGVWRLCWQQLLAVTPKFTATASVDGQYTVVDSFAGVNADGDWELRMTCTGVGSGEEYGRYAQVRMDLADHVGKTLSFRYASASTYADDATRGIWFRDANDEAFEKHYLEDDAGAEVSYVIPAGTYHCRIYVWTYPDAGETLTSHMVVSDVRIDGEPIM